MKNKKIIIPTIISIIILTLFCLWQNNVLKTSYYTISSHEIPKNFDEYCIVQISDLHNKKFGRKQQYLMDQIKELDPDMIVVTGDIVDSNHTDIDTAVTFLEEAMKMAPCYYVTGNHERWLDDDVYDQLMSRIEQTGTIILDNEVTSINTESDDKENTADLVLIGLDDGSLLGNTLHELSKDIDKEKFVVLLAHEPQNMEFYCMENVDLILSGHAHGGQFRLPIVGGLVAPDQGFLPKYTEGLHVENDVVMIISRGLGNSIIPLRIMNQPDIVCVELETE